MYLSGSERGMLETTLFNLGYDMDCIGGDAEIYAEIARLSDAELETLINDILSNI